jgi:hypothetical protein
MKYQNIVRERDYQVKINADWDDELNKYCKTYKVSFGKIQVTTCYISKLMDKNSQMYPNGCSIKKFDI